MSFLQALNDNLLIADGGMATELQKRGLPPREGAAAWSLAHPDAVATAHRTYVAAGADIVLTNTLTANRATVGNDCESLHRAATALARQSGARWVAGSLGPGGDEAQAAALAGAGVDLFWIETQFSLKAALETVAACRRANPALPVVLTFSFHGRTAETDAGETPTEITLQCESVGIDALGVNCGNGFMHLATVLAQFAAATAMPLVLKPNAGVPVIIDEELRYPLTIKDWVAQIVAIKRNTVRIIGGCCGTTPMHIAALREAYS